jgi:hypothetical protein
MSISSQRSPSWVNDDWDALVAREGALQAAIEAALDRADECDADGDFQLALEWLDRASELSGGLSATCRAQRARIADELDAGTR